MERYSSAGASRSLSHPKLAQHGTLRPALPWAEGEILRFALEKGGTYGGDVPVLSRPKMPPFKPVPSIACGPGRKYSIGLPGGRKVAPGETRIVALLSLPTER
jgi:hypothetical protein